ncbi:MAG: hypothetical protein LBU91_07815 [Bacteroidales bacterium]|jgi:hypothetical protein|nr:hypothetical protein [Bacteroidales bacterium]
MKATKILLWMCIACIFSACAVKDDFCPPPAGKGINNLDWDNYNEVSLVYANNHLLCSDPRVNENNGKSIKIYGWLVNKDLQITIIGDSLYASGQTERGYWGIPIACTSDIQATIDTLDLTRKCFLKGDGVRN